MAQSTNPAFKTAWRDTLFDYIEGHSSTATQEAIVALGSRLKNGDTPPSGCLLQVQGDEVIVAPNVAAMSGTGGNSTRY